MAEAKNNVNSDVSSVKKEEQIVQRIVELLNERGYEYERDARPIIYWKYDVKSSRELTLKQKEEVLKALEEGEFEQWGADYKTQVLDKQMDIVREIEKMNGAPSKIELDSSRNVAVATETKEQPVQDKEPDSKDLKKEETVASKTKTPSKISLKKDETSKAESPKDKTEEKSSDSSDKSEVRLLPKKDNDKEAKDQKKPLLKAGQVTLDVKPKQKDVSQDASADKQSEEKAKESDTKSIDISLPSNKKDDAKQETAIQDKDKAPEPKKTATADAIMNQMRGVAQDADAPKTQVAPQEVVAQKVEQQAEQPKDASSVKNEPVTSSASITVPQPVDTSSVQDDKEQKRKFKARRYSKKDQLTVNTGNEAPVGMELSEAERIVQNKFSDEYEQESVSIVSVAMLVVSLGFLSVSVYTNMILLMNKDFPGWLASLCNLFS